MLQRLMPAFFALCLAAFALGPSPESVISLSPQIDTAEARAKGRAGGFRGAGRAAPRGARVRPGGSRWQQEGRPGRPAMKPGRPQTKPARPGNRPGAGNRPRPDRPVAGKPGRPGRPGAGNRPNRPGVGGWPNRPNRPGAGNRPIRPGVDHRPGRPGAGHRPGVRPPAHRPARPVRPGWRPPYYRPPLWRPPAWRPPYYRPPYARPPHYRWGRYYWYPSWGWYFTAAVAGATLVYVATLPDERECERVLSEGETLYVCDGILYRPTVYRDEEVYEIVSEPEERLEDGVVEDVVPDRILHLTSPRIRGADVRALQTALTDAGYPVGTMDGVFGPATDRSLREFQRDRGLRVTGYADAPTREALGL